MQEHAKALRRARRRPRRQVLLECRGRQPRTGGVLPARRVLPGRRAGRGSGTAGPCVRQERRPGLPGHAAGHAQGTGIRVAAGTADGERARTLCAVPRAVRTAGHHGRARVEAGRFAARQREKYNAFVGALESRVLPSARRIRDLDPGLGAEHDPAAALHGLPVIEATPRALGAAELLEAPTRVRPRTLRPVCCALTRRDARD